MPNALSAADWPQWLGPVRNGSSPEIISTNNWPREGPRQVWQQAAGPGFSSPVVADGRLITFQRHGSSEVVTCLHALTGSLIWSNAYPTRYRDDHGFDDGPRGTPAVKDGRVFTFGAEGQLHCWNLAQGTKLWNVDTKTKYRADKGFFGMACSPLVESNTVIVIVGGENAGIVAFDAASGQERWKTGSDDASYSSPVSATIAKRRYGLALTRSGLTALDPVDGKQLFHYPWRPAMEASVSAATPLVIGDMIFISASYGAGAVLLRWQEPKPVSVWSGDDILSNHYATSVHQDGFLYGFDGRQEQGCHLRCVELKTGKVRWTEDRFGAGTLLAAGGCLLILKENGELIQAATSPESFRIINRASILGFETRAAAALADGLYYAPSKRQLVCVDLRTNKNP